MTRLALFAALVVGTVHVAGAASISFTGTSNSGYTYQYILTLPNHNQHLFTNDHFTIYDFYDPQSFSTPSGSWVASTQLNAPGASNDGMIADVTFTYIGDMITGPAILDFSITSSNNAGRSDDSVLSFHKKQGQSIVPDTVAGTVTVADAPLETVPEPTSMVLALAGLALLSLRKLC